MRQEMLPLQLFCGYNAEHYFQVFNFQFPISHSPFPIPHSLFPIPYSLFPIPYSLFLIPYSLFPIPYSLFPIPYSLFPIPYSPFPVLAASLQGFCTTLHMFKLNEPAPEHLKCFDIQVHDSRTRDSLHIALYKCHWPTSLNV